MTNMRQEFFRCQGPSVLSNESKDTLLFNCLVSMKLKFPRFYGAARGTSTRTHVGKGRFEVFDDVSQKTGAYIKPPSYNDQVDSPFCE